MLASQNNKMPIDELSKSIADGARKNTAITHYRDEIPLINEEVFGQQDIINPSIKPMQQKAYRRSLVEGIPATHTQEVNQTIQTSHARSTSLRNIPWWVIFIILSIIIGCGLWMIWRFGTNTIMMPPPGLPGVGGAPIISRTNSMIDPISGVPQVTQTTNMVAPTAPITPPITTPLNNQMLNPAVNPMINPMTTNINLPSAVPTTIIQNKTITPNGRVTQRIQTANPSPLQPQLNMPIAHHLNHILSYSQQQPIQQNLKCRFRKFNHNKENRFHQQKQQHWSKSCDQVRSKHLRRRIR